jgi:hypothetical protein
MLQNAINNAKSNKALPAPYNTKKHPIPSLTTKLILLEWVSNAFLIHLLSLDMRMKCSRWESRGDVAYRQSELVPAAGDVIDILDALEHLSKPSRPLIHPGAGDGDGDGHQASKRRPKGPRACHGHPPGLLG